MFVLVGRYRVGERERFLEVFGGFEEARRAAGATGRRVLGSGGDAAGVVVEIEFGSREEAEAFAGGAARAGALADAGVLEHDDEIYEDITP